MNYSLSDFYSVEINRALEIIGSAASGLTQEEANKRLKIFGPNEIAGRTKKTLLSKLVSVFFEPMVIVLFFASIFAFLAHELISSAVILGVIFINTAVSLIQDFKAEKAVEELKKMLLPRTRVIRENLIEIIPTKFLVPGDIIIFEAGDIIPADSRIIEANDLLVDEAHLTGESLPVEKNNLPLLEKNLKPYQMKNIVFAGSHVLNGAGKALVITTANLTEMGKIAQEITETEDEKTPLQKKINREINQLVFIALISAGLVFLVQFIKSAGFESLQKISSALLLATSVMVAVFPEGLPASITIALALAVERLAKNSVITKKLSSVETLGNVDFICTDKTGTITSHHMTVKEFFLGGSFYNNTELFKMAGKEETKILEKIFLIANKCSTASVEEKEGNITKETGDPTETALIKAGIILGFKPDYYKNYKIVDFVPFSSDLKFSSAIVETPNREKYFLLKGAPGKVLEKTSTIYYQGKFTFLSEDLKKTLSQHLKERSSHGFRLISLAIKELTNSEKPELKNPTDLIFLGTAVIYDPPKEEVFNVIKEVKEAGIKVVMITGDSKNTGFAIAHQVGIAENINQVIEGSELEKIPDKDLSQKIEDIRVYSRVTPHDKLKIVNHLKEKEHIVAMTGDGVNDAPALKKADVGVAMGRSGSQVSLEAADIILTDDNFATIVKAIKEGRTVYQNLKKLIIYLLTNNIGKVFALVLVPFFGLGAPLYAIQVLLSNVVMESLPSVALSTDPAGFEILRKKPVKISEPLILKNERYQLIFEGIIFGLSISCGFFITILLTGSQELARTVAFVITLLSPQIFIFALREGNLIQKITAPNKLLKILFGVTILIILGLIYNPTLNLIFKTTPFYSLKIWIIIFILSLTTTIFHLLFRARP